MEIPEVVVEVIVDETALEAGGIKAEAPSTYGAAEDVVGGRGVVLMLNVRVEP